MTPRAGARAGTVTGECEVEVGVLCQQVVVAVGVDAICVDGVLQQSGQSHRGCHCLTYTEGSSWLWYPSDLSEWRACFVDGGVH